GRVLVGAPLDDATAQNGGAAYLIDPATGRVVQTFHNPARGAFDRFGASVGPAASGLIIGAPGPGHVYVYRNTESSGIGQALRNVFVGTAVAAGPRCGNGVVEGTEWCDDGNDIDTDDCRNDCTRPLCCVIDPQAIERCNDFDPCTDDSVDSNGACV